MLRLLTITLILTAGAGGAPAFGSDDPDMMGFFFDPGAETFCLAAELNANLTGYIALTHPTMDAIGGFEVGYDLTGSALVLTTTFSNPQSLDVGRPGNHIVGFGAPLACSEVTVLATLSLLYLDPSARPVEITLHGTTPSSLDPALPTVLLTDDSLQSTGVIRPFNTFSATINGSCGEVDDATWDRVKSLYR